MEVSRTIRSDEEEAPSTTPTLRSCARVQRLDLLVRETEVEPKRPHRPEQRANTASVSAAPPRPPFRVDSAYNVLPIYAPTTITRSKLQRLIQEAFDMACGDDLLDDFDVPFHQNQETQVVTSDIGSDM